MFAFDGATASAILPYGFSGSPWLLVGAISVQWSPPSVVLKSPLPGPPERDAQPRRRKSDTRAYKVWGRCGFVASIAHPVDSLAPASILFHVVPPSQVL